MILCPDCGKFGYSNECEYCGLEFCDKCINGHLDYHKGRGDVPLTEKQMAERKSKVRLGNYFKKMDEAIPLLQTDEWARRRGHFCRSDDECRLFHGSLCLVAIDALTPAEGARTK